MPVNFSSVFIYTDQPTTCPECSSRTDVVLDLSHTKDKTEIHQCLDPKCECEFVMQYDDDFENGSLL